MKRSVRHIYMIHDNKLVITFFPYIVTLHEGHRLLIQIGVFNRRFMRQAFAYIAGECGSRNFLVRLLGYYTGYTCMSHRHHCGLVKVGQLALLRPRSLPDIIYRFRAYTGKKKNNP